jgi:hypothetical protein
MNQRQETRRMVRGLLLLLLLLLLHKRFGMIYIRILKWR